MVVIKKLLQLAPKDHKDLIVRVAKMVDNLTVPMAKASILWMIGEYCNFIPKIAPDILRKSAKSFPNEDDIVKLQIVNLAAKLVVTNPKQTRLLSQYVMNMARYDVNYDVRDRARFLRQLITTENNADEEVSALSKYAKKILLSTKPAPVLESIYKARDHWQLGSLSHYLNTEANGYIPFLTSPMNLQIHQLERLMRNIRPSMAAKLNQSKIFTAQKKILRKSQKVMTSTLKTVKNLGVRRRSLKKMNLKRKKKMNLLMMLRTC